MALREAAFRSRLKLDAVTWLDTMLLTGLRYVEAQRLQGNPDWFDGRFIHIPEMKLFRVRRQRERWVILNPRGRAVVPYFLYKTKKLPSWRGLSDNLKRWAKAAGLNPTGLSPKTTRKTWESWLVAIYPHLTVAILRSQGHTTRTALDHYIGIPFTRVDRLEMLEWVEGWDMAVRSTQPLGGLPGWGYGA